MIKNLPNEEEWLRDEPKERLRMRLQQTVDEDPSSCQRWILGEN